MKAAIFERHGGVAELTVADLPDPECGNGAVIVRVGATSLNGFDPMILAGSTGLKTPLPMTPCGDFAGQIVERGTHETLIRREGRYHAMYTTQHGLTANLFLSPGEESKAAPKEEDRADKARGEGVPVGGQRVLEILRE